VIWKKLSFSSESTVARSLWIVACNHCCSIDCNVFESSMGSAAHATAALNSMHAIPTRDMGFI
jgi:hypothetical protein